MHKSQFLILSIFLLATSCKTTAPVKQTVAEPEPAIQVGGEHFSIEDYQDAYSRNKYSEDSTRALTPEEYLKIYTEQKMKVLEARQAGKDTTEDYREEITSYHDQLAKNHLVDKALVEKLTNEAYNRMRQEVKASHILIRVAEEASPADTLEAHRAAIALRGRLEEGSDFADIAAKFSADPAAKTTRGDLGYFTAFQTVYPLETAAYTLSIGRVSQPIRTRAGYHLLKVYDRRANRGMVQIAHILVQADSSVSETKKVEAKSRIDAAYKELQDGKDWAAVVDQYSDDKQSKRNKGILPLFGTGQMVHEIEEAAYAMNRAGEYSKPIKTIYGWHIIQFVEKKPLESLANMAPMLRKKVVTDSRGKVIEQANTKRLRDKYAVQEFPDQWQAVTALQDSTLITGKWDFMRAVTQDWSSSTLFKIEQQPYDAQSFLNFVKRKQQPKQRGSSPAVIFKNYYQDYLAESLSEYERAHLEETNPEFKSIMNELREGVLMQQLMEENVWQKSLADSVGQLAFYEGHKDRYRFPERALATLITAKDTQTINIIRKAIATSPYRLERKSDELLFEEGKSEIVSAHGEALQDLKIIMQKNPGYIVEVAGYRSADESEATSAARIRNVIKYLNSQNIPILRITEKDYGSFRQAAEAERNRRVSFQFYSSSVKDVEKVYNSDTKGTVIIDEGYYTKDNPIFARIKWQEGEQVSQVNNAVTWVNVKKLEPSRGKTFAEARGSVVNDYQKELEKQWLAKLQQKFPVKVNSQELEKIKR